MNVNFDYKKVLEGIEETNRLAKIDAVFDSVQSGVKFSGLQGEYKIYKTGESNYIIKDGKAWKVEEDGHGGLKAWNTGQEASVNGSTINITNHAGSPRTVNIQQVVTGFGKVAPAQ